MLVQGDDIIVDALCIMESWRSPGRYRPVAVDWRGTRYAVRHEEASNGGRAHYTLSPWQERDGEFPTSVIEYGAQYVEDRDARNRHGQRIAISQFVLAPLAALVGFLPGLLQEKIEHSVGIGRLSATSASLLLEKGVILVLGTLSVLHLCTHAVFSGELENLPWVVPPLIVDQILRRSAFDEEPPRTFGFFEWLWPPRWF